MENNKIIAEFMGYKISDRGEYLLSDSLPQFLGSDHREWCSNKVENDNLIWEIPKDCLEYHSSWDWLMPVVEKIEHKIEPEVRVLIYEDEVEIWQKTEPKWTELVNVQANGDGKLSNTYKAVVEFIKEYNYERK